MVTSTSGAARLRNFVLPDFQETDVQETDVQVQPQPQSGDGAEILRIIAIGSPPSVDQHIRQMYLLGYAQPHEWSRALPTAHPNQIMRVMTKRILKFQG